MGLSGTGSKEVGRVLVAGGLRLEATRGGDLPGESEFRVSIFVFRLFPLRRHPALYLSVGPAGLPGGRQNPRPAAVPCLEPAALLGR